MRPGEGQNREIDRDQRRAVEKALRAAGDVRSILDAGAGNGRWFDAFLARKPRLLVGLDLTLDNLEEARKAGARAALVRGDVGALPFPPQSFDLVACLGLMPHVRSAGRLRALREMRRVSSRWVLVEYAHTEGMGLAWQRLRRRVGLDATFPRGHLSGRQIEHEMRRAGLGIRGYARIGGAFSTRWMVLAEAPSSDWMQA